MSELPKEWIKATFSTLCGSGQYGWTTKATAEGIIKYLRTTDITKGQIDWQNVPYCTEIPSDFEKYEVRKGDILISRAGSVGFSVLISTIPVKTVFASYLIRFIPSQEVESRYIAFFLKSPEYWQQISEVSSGIALANVNAKKLAALQIPLAPLNEQRRIEDKLDRILAKVDACRQRCDRIPLLLKRFRQSVLAAATSGQLTEDWREEHRKINSREEIGNELTSFSFADTDCFGNYNFPESWNTARLEEISEITGGITKDSKRQNPDYEELPYLRVANVQRGFLDLTEIKTIRVPKQRIEGLLLQSGDILFNEGGDIDTLGRGWIWNNEIERCTFQNHVFRARLKNANFEPKFFSWYGNSRGFEYFLAFGKQTTNLASINKTVLSSLPVVIPPADEQREIARRVETLFAYADRLEAQYQRARAHIDRLTPALLDKAFRGELVPQDPKDEPASVLLARLQAGRAQGKSPFPRQRNSN